MMIAMATAASAAAIAMMKMVKKQPVHSSRPQVFIKGNKVQVHTIQDQFLCSSAS